MPRLQPATRAALIPPPCHWPPLPPLASASEHLKKPWASTELTVTDARVPATCFMNTDILPHLPLFSLKKCTVTGLLALTTYLL